MLVDDGGGASGWSSPDDIAEAMQPMETEGFCAVTLDSQSTYSDLT